MDRKRIPFDSLCLYGVCAELQQLIGGKLQAVVRLGPWEFGMAIYTRSKETWVFVSIDSEFARLHLLRAKPRETETADEFVRLLRTNLLGSRIVSIEQTRFDRLLTVAFQAEHERYDLKLELMGKHSNVILITHDRKIVACAKPVGTTKSKRPVLVGKVYEDPPVGRQVAIGLAGSMSELQKAEGVSPFLFQLVRSKVSDDFEAAKALILSWKQAASNEGGWLDTESGAYPIDPSTLGYEATRKPSLSSALESFYGEFIQRLLLARRRDAFKKSLDRVRYSRLAAIHDLDEAISNARQAPTWQMMGELLLAYQSGVTHGAQNFVVTGYDGEQVTIRLDPDLGPLENAACYFERAKKAKKNLGLRREQVGQLRLELSELETLIVQVDAADSSKMLSGLENKAREKRWLFGQQSNSRKSDAPAAAPFQGHKIRSLVGPQGLTILYGENATSNDYLTLRIAKPNDYWLHVRGMTSAHVVIQTGNQPQKVSADALRFAAGIAVSHSSAKHSKYVPVDYTLKKYVRKPKGAPVGSATYSHEKTLHVERKE